MTEITPISPSPAIVGVSREQRNKSRKNKAQQKTQPEKPNVEQPESEQQPISHIDEIV